MATFSVCVPARDYLGHFTNFAGMRDAEADSAVAEITVPESPGERLMVCLNPRLREERRRKREDLLEATERTLADIAAAAARGKPGQTNRDRTIFESLNLSKPA